MAALLALAAVGCASGGSSADPPDVTLPGSIDAPVDPHATVTTPTSSSAPSSTTTTAAGGLATVESLRAEPGAAACVAGTIPVVVTFSVRSVRPVRVFNVYLDGAREPAASSNTADPLTIAAVPCDGQSHQVLLIAAVDQDDVATQSAAFRAPGPA